MGAAVNGMAAHGGVLPFSATFLVFSDYMKPAIRLGALSKLKAFYVFTHDSVGVGEDGPTHEPIEQLAGLRAIPGLNVMRPADATETAEGWAVAIQHNGPTLFALTRQNILHLDRSKAKNRCLERRLHSVGGGGRRPRSNPDRHRVGSVAVHESPGEAEGLRRKARVVSMPSWNLFKRRTKLIAKASCRRAIKKRVTVEAPQPLWLAQWAGDEGTIIGDRSLRRLCSRRQKS